MTIQPYQETTYHPATREPAAHERWLEVYQPMIELASRLANSPFVPDGMRGDAGAVFSVILAGHGMGLHPIASLQSISMIKGKPYIDTEVYLGLAFNAGHSVHWGECTEKRATVRVIRGDGLGSVETTYTLAQAQLAGYAGKDNWRRMPGEMLKARAVRAALKMVAPDLLMGVEPADDALTTGQEGGSQPTGVSVVQLAGPAPEPAAAPPASAITAPAPVTEQRTDEPPADVSTEPAEPLGPEPITPPQMRKISAQIRELERLDERKFNREERREFIGTLVGIPDLGSANDLTKEEASRAIEELTRVIGDAMERAAADPAVVTETGEIQDPEGAQA